MKIAIVLILCFGIGLVASAYEQRSGSGYDTTKHSDGNGYGTTKHSDGNGYDTTKHSDGNGYDTTKHPDGYKPESYDDHTAYEDDSDADEPDEDDNDDEKKEEEHVEFASDDFKELEPIVPLYDAENATRDQPKCEYVNECYRKFSPFGEQCSYRVYHYGNYPSNHGDGYSTQVHGNGYGNIYDRCNGHVCARIVVGGFSDSHGYVKLFKPFSECGTECDNPKPYSAYAKYANYCGRVTENGKTKCSCDTVFCVKSLKTAFFDRCGKLRIGTIRYKFQCKCSCRS